MHEDKEAMDRTIDADEPIEIEFIDEDDEAEDIAGGAPAATSEGGEQPVAAGGDGDLLRAEVERMREMYLRKLAEFDNFRKRTERERVEIKRHAHEDLVRELLPVLDNFDRALEHRSESDVGAFHEGVEMIAKQLWDTLERQGVEVIDPMGEQFSPEYHEAVHQVEDESLEPGTVASVLAKGYVCNGRLVRPAMVGVVSDPPKQIEPPTESSNGEVDE